MEKVQSAKVFKVFSPMLVNAIIGVLFFLNIFAIFKISSTSPEYEINIAQLLGEEFEATIILLPR